MTEGSAGQLERELKDAFKNRALIYWAIYAELRTELGAEKAGKLLAHAIERRGREAGDALFRGVAADPRAIAERFLAVSPAEGRLFPTDVRRDDKGGVHIQVKACPLKEAWEEAKLPPADMATICRIAGHFDNGVFGGRGIAFSADTWTEGKAGCCHLHLERAG
ncbi:MAG: hypothetical protein EXQ95_01055 [Alphaproteobacteria bacterium]|nr:hypothetical protein [Alphaproteobacteria bacterium]